MVCRSLLGLSALFGLAACAQLPFGGSVLERPAEPVPEIASELAAPPPPPSARTVEQFDTTTAEQRAAATAEPSGATTLLGTTVASLGDPTRAGFWMETPLIEAATRGMLEYPETGKSVEVEMFPIEGGGSRVSLAALRVLDAPLTDLPVLNVYGN